MKKKLETKSSSNCLILNDSIFTRNHSGDVFIKDAIIPVKDIGTVVRISTYKSEDQTAFFLSTRSTRVKELAIIALQ